ncbi:hypothetical protein POG20_19160 [Blautia wexlerae]|nr:hypothetical protein [Blautia wexlerae]
MPFYGIAGRFVWEMRMISWQGIFSKPSLVKEGTYCTKQVL